MSMEDLPKATHEGIIKLGNIEIRVYRLDTGEAIIHAEDLPKIFEADFTQADADTFAIELAKIGHSIN